MPANSPFQVSGSAASDPSAAFDFLMGEWNVRHRKLKRRLAGADDWWEVAGRCSAGKILGGLGNLDDNILYQPDGEYRGATLRLFIPTSGLWSIWWISSLRSEIEPPVSGRFDNGIGTFFGDDMLKDRPVRVRFIWSDIMTGTPRWEQAFSPDQGRTWETNWIMDFRRSA